MTNWQKPLISLVFLAVMLGFAYLQTQAPAPRTDTGLDYTALTEHVAVIAAKPHPMGSQANREARDYIVRYFEGLGLETEVQKTTVVYRHPFQSQNRTIIGSVENVIARLPGTAKAAGQEMKDLLLMAHYDSRADGPGAGDDASGTASIMEVARIMVDGPAPLRDVVFLITDGEEMGLLGAQGYFRQHSTAKDVGLVLNFEARGSSGTSSMFETSDGNSWLVEQLRGVAPDLVASSLSYEIYQRMPNDTDMSISRGEGIAGLNFAFISGLYDYHAMSDSPENLDPNTLVQQANYVLASAQHFANLDQWAITTENSSYFTVWTGVTVAYSQNLAIILGLLVLLSGVWLFARALRAGIISWASLGSGLISLVVLIIFISNVFESMIDYQSSADAGIARLISLGEWPLLAYSVLTIGMVAWFGHALKRGIGNRATLIAVLLLASVMLVSGRPWMTAIGLPLILAPLLRFVGGRSNRANLWGATIVVWWLLAATVLFIAPNASYALIWPLASVLLGIALWGRFESLEKQFASVLGASIIPLILLAPLIILAYLALGTTLPQGIMILTVLCLLMIWPLISNIGSMANGKGSAVLIGAGLVMTLSVLFGRGFDSRHPRGEELFYAFDAEQRQGFWLSPDAREGSWLEEFIGSDAENFNVTQILPGYEQEAMMRATAAPEVRAATLVVTNDQLIDGKRELRLQLRSPVGAEYINLLLSRELEFFSATVNGFPVVVPVTKPVETSGSQGVDAMKAKDKSQSEAWWRWRWYGLPQEGAEIVLTIAVNQALTVKIIEVDYGMPDGAPARPVDSMPKPYTWSDSMVIFQTLNID